MYVGLARGRSGFCAFDSGAAQVLVEAMPREVREKDKDRRPSRPFLKMRGAGGTSVGGGAAPATIPEGGGGGEATGVSDIAAEAVALTVSGAGGISGGGSVSSLSGSMSGPSAGGAAPALRLRGVSIASADGGTGPSAESPALRVTAPTPPPAPATAAASPPVVVPPAQLSAKVPLPSVPPTVTGRLVVTVVSAVRLPEDRFNKIGTPHARVKVTFFSVVQQCVGGPRARATAAARANAAVHRSPAPVQCSIVPDRALGLICKFGNEFVFDVTHPLASSVIYIDALAFYRCDCGGAGGGG